MIQVIINGLLIGGVYALVAVGLTMIFGVMKIVNFAQGEFLMIGMFVTWGLYFISGEGSNPYWIVLPVAVIMAVFGMFVFRVFIKPVVGKDASNYIVLTFGLSYLLQNLVQFFFGANFKSLPIDRAMKIGVFQIGELVLLKPRVIAFGIVLVFVVLVFIFLNKTNTGRAMRATAESIEISETLGINTKKSFMAAFAIGTMFAGVAGMLLTPIYYVYPRVGVLFSMTATSCLVLGGLGNITGALVGGLLIGLVEAFTTTYIDGNLAPVSINLVLILVLVFKPTGLFGRRMRSA